MDPFLGLAAADLMTAHRTNVGAGWADLCSRGSQRCLASQRNQRARYLALNLLRRPSHEKGKPLSLLVLDIDHSKRVNDCHGHTVGDLVLKEVATLIVARSRHSDVACRVGCEEFVVIVPGLESGFAAVSAETLRRAVADTGTAIGDGREIHVTVSLGLATLRPDETAGILFHRADAALYGAKRGGRDRVGLAA